MRSHRYWTMKKRRKDVEGKITDVVFLLISERKKKRIPSIDTMSVDFLKDELFSLYRCFGLGFWIPCLLCCLLATLLALAAILIPFLLAGKSTTTTATTTATTAVYTTITSAPTTITTTTSTPSEFFCHSRPL